MSTELVMPSNHLILCHPILLWSSIFPRIRVFSSGPVLCIRWPTYWSFSFSISPSNEYSGLIFFRIDWFDLFAVQGTLKSLLQHHSSKAPILQHSGFFMVQLSHPYMTTWKTTALTRWTSLVVQTVKNLPAMQETWVLSLVWEDPLEEGMATHPSILAWRIPMAEKFGGLQSMESQRVRYNWLTKHNTQHCSLSFLECKHY